LGWTIEEALTTPALPPSTHKIRTKLTKDMIETLGQLIDNGTSYTAACKAAGIGVRTFYSWLYRAESDGGLYAELKERVRWQAPQQRSGDKTNAETAQETA
jgi:transposase